jgi:transposase
MIPRLIQLHWKTRVRMNILRKEAEQDGAYRVARRFHAVILNSEGHTSGEVARVLKAPRSKVSLWLSNYNEYGVEGLLEGHRCGRPGELNETQGQALADIVESGPVAYGFDCGVWTSPRIARVIEEEFGIHYHSGHVRKVLRRMGFSVQRPRRVLARANPAEQDRWRRYDYPRLKKKPGAKSAR